MKRILVLCTGNRNGDPVKPQPDGPWVFATLCRNERRRIECGCRTHGLNPKAVQVMAEDGVDISQHTSNLVDEYAHLPIDFVITVCDSASERCLDWPDAPHAP
jgi:arsenate reductase